MPSVRVVLTGASPVSPGIRPGIGPGIGRIVQAMQSLGVTVGDHVFLDHIDEEVGAVRQIAKDYLVVYIENAGDFIVKGDQVKSVHDSKVILDSTTVDKELLAATKKAHVAETQ